MSPDYNVPLASSVEDLYISLTNPYFRSPKIRSLYNYIKSCGKYKGTGGIEDDIQSFILKILEKELDPSKFTYRILIALARDTTNKDGVRYYSSSNKSGKYMSIEKRKIVTEPIPDDFDRASNIKTGLDALADKEDLEYLAKRYSNKTFTTELEKDYINFLNGRVSDKYATYRERLEDELYRDYKRRLKALESTIDDYEPTYPIVFFGNDYPELDYVSPETKRYIRSDGKAIHPLVKERTYCGKYKGWEWYKKRKVR